MQPAQETTLQVADLCCAAEVALVEDALKPVAGVTDVHCNPVTRQVVVHHDPDRVSAGQLIVAIGRVGMKATLAGGRGGEDLRGQRQHLIATALAGSFVGLGWLTHWRGGPAGSEIGAFAVAVVAGGWFIAPKAAQAAARLRPDMNLLMCIAALGAVGIRAWDEAAAVMFLFSLAELFESFSLSRARRAIAALMQLAPDTALVKRESDLRELPVAEVNVGDVIVIKPGARIPLDGGVLSGESNVNEAPITGESLPVAKRAGSEVFAGSINERGALEVRVTKPAAASTLARIIHLVEEAQSQKAPAQRFVDVFAHYYTPIVIGLAGLLAVGPPLVFGQEWGMWFYRALVMLVIACPCALVISTPVSVVSALTAAARHGVLIKGGVVLETLGRLRALALDKTGTITEGRPRVIEVIAVNNAAPDDVLRIAAALEAHSEHPVAQAILEHCRQKGLLVTTGEAFQSLPGKGVTGRVDDRDYFVGNERLAEDLGAGSLPVERRAQTAVVVGRSGAVLGVIAIGDAIRPQAAAAIQQLRRAGLRRIVMLTGDNRATAAAIAQQAGITEVEAELLPEEKVTRLRALLREEEHVGMVGDGVNDAPALAAASVGIAMGVAGTDAALETADVALMADDLGKLPEVITLGRRTEGIIRFNIAVSVIAKLVFMGLATAGLATLWMAVAADMGTSLIVIANGLRLLRQPPGPRQTGRQK